MVSATQARKLVALDEAIMHTRNTYLHCVRNVRGLNDMLNDDRRLSIGILFRCVLVSFFRLTRIALIECFIPSLFAKRT